MANDDCTDRFILQPEIPTGVQELKIILNSFIDGAVDVKNLLTNECNIIIECRFCRDSFRSLAKFVAHKKVDCKERFVEHRNLDEKEKDKTAELFKADDTVSLDDIEENDKFETENISEKSSDKSAYDKGADEIIRKSKCKMIEIKSKSKTRQPRELSKLKWTMFENKKRISKSNVTSKSEQMERSKPKRMKRALDFQSSPTKLTQKKQDIDSSSKEVLPSTKETKPPATNKDSKLPIIFSEKQKEKLLNMMNEKELLCKKCSKKFTLKCNLEHHCYTHLGFIRFKCSSCDFRAFFRYDLQNHVMTKCGYVKRSERKTFNKSKLDSFIVPACAEEPGRVVVQESGKDTKKKKSCQKNQKHLSDKLLKEGRVSSDQSKFLPKEIGQTKKTYDEELGDKCIDEEVFQKISSTDNKKITNDNNAVAKTFNDIEREIKINTSRESSKNCDGNVVKNLPLKKRPLENDEEQKVKEKVDTDFCIDEQHGMKLEKRTVSESEKDVGKKTEAVDSVVLNGDEVITGIKQGQNLIQGVVSSPAHVSPSVLQRSFSRITNPPTTKPSEMLSVKQQTTVTCVLQRDADGKLCIRIVAPNTATPKAY